MEKLKMFFTGFSGVTLVTYADLIEKMGTINSIVETILQLMIGSYTLYNLIKSKKVIKKEIEKDNNLNNEKDGNN